MCVALHEGGFVHGCKIIEVGARGSSAGNDVDERVVEEGPVKAARPESTPEQFACGVGQASKKVIRWQ